MDAYSELGSDFELTGDDDENNEKENPTAEVVNESGEIFLKKMNQETKPGM